MAEPKSLFELAYRKTNRSDRDIIDTLYGLDLKIKDIQKKAVDIIEKEMKKYKTYETCIEKCMNLDYNITHVELIHCAAYFVHLGFFDRGVRDFVYMGDYSDEFKNKLRVAFIVTFSSAEINQCFRDMNWVPPSVYEDYVDNEAWVNNLINKGTTKVLEKIFSYDKHDELLTCLEHNMTYRKLRKFLYIMTTKDQLYEIFTRYNEDLDEYITNLMSNR